MLAEIYAEALKDQGATISTKLNIGSREKYLPGAQGRLDRPAPRVQRHDPAVHRQEGHGDQPDDVFAALTKALPSNLIV